MEKEESVSEDARGELGGETAGSISGGTEESGELGGVAIGETDLVKRPVRGFRAERERSAARILETTNGVRHRRERVMECQGYADHKQKANYARFRGGIYAVSPSKKNQVQRRIQRRLYARCKKSGINGGYMRVVFTRSQEKCREIPRVFQEQ